MIKKILSISGYNKDIRICDYYIVFYENKKEVFRCFCGDIDILLIDSQNIAIDVNSILKITEFGGCVFLCDYKHMPTAVFSPLNAFSTPTRRLIDQVNLNDDLRKNIHNFIIKNKIEHQLYRCLDLKNFVNGIDLNSAAIYEGKVAQIYWNKFFNFEFYRNRKSEDVVNCLLNYGYTIIRTKFCQSLVSHGLNGCLGIFHKHPSNNFCLSDDLMEPYRPYIDVMVKEIAKHNDKKNLDKQLKEKIISVLYRKILMKNKNLKILDAIEKTVISYVKTIEQKDNYLEYPQFEQI